VNWFRRGADGRFLWPGYGENVRILKWMLERIEGRAAATETPIGFVPTPDSLTLDGLSFPKENLDELLRVDPANWIEEQASTAKFLEKFGKRLPPEIGEEHEALAHRLERVASATK
jgi:phosphoenolpyruvate carboxykinase (GTP)